MKVISTILSASVLVDSVAGLIRGDIIWFGHKTYMTGLRTTIEPNSDDNYSFCAGALITPTHVLTSAFCTSQFPANYAVVGAHFSYANSSDGEAIKVLKVTPHPHFDLNTKAYDVAILTLERATTIRPITLPTPTDAKKVVSVFGWGATSPDGPASAEVRKISQRLITSEACSGALNIPIEAYQFCGEKLRYGGSPCSGDTGDPVITEVNASKDDDDILVGVVSGGVDCDNGSPTIYTSVAAVVPWINEQIQTRLERQD